MKRLIATTVVFAALCGLGPDLSACGDKFLTIGRGVRFQKAYAAIHPAAILLVLPPKSVKNAAIRDSRLQAALRIAGHRVDVVKSAMLADVLDRSRYDIILAERADAIGISASLPSGPRKPSVIGVLEGKSGDAVAAQGLDGVLKTPQPLFDVLRLFDDVMKARVQKSRVTVP